MTLTTFFSVAHNVCNSAIYLGRGISPRRHDCHHPPRPRLCSLAVRTPRPSRRACTSCPGGPHLCGINRTERDITQRRPKRPTMAKVETIRLLLHRCIPPHRRGVHHWHNGQRPASINSKSTRALHRSLSLLVFLRLHAGSILRLPDCSPSPKEPNNFHMATPILPRYEAGDIPR